MTDSIKVCMWQGCIQRAEIMAWFNTPLKRDSGGKVKPLRPCVYCWDHFCRVDDLFDLDRASILDEALIRSA